MVFSKNYSPRGYVILSFYIAFLLFTGMIMVYPIFKGYFFDIHKGREKQETN